MKKLILGLVALMALTFVACEDDLITVVTYHVTFNSDGGSYVAYQEIEDGSSAIKPEMPTKGNGSFKGWFLNDSLFNFSSIIDSSFTLTAKWTITDGQMSINSFEDINLNSNGLFQNDSLSGSIESGNLALTCTWSSSDWGTFGSGFSVSNHKDITTTGFTNPYSCIAESGAYNSENFAVYNNSSDSVSFKSPSDMESIMLCNNTYAYLSMLNGDSFAKKFGGIDGTDEDYFKVIVSLYTEDGTMLGDEDFYLADFRGDAAYIVKEWTKLDLSAYKAVSYMKFSFESTDTSDWGFNTPAYFCLDNIAYYTAE